MARKRSPRAPSYDLESAIGRAVAVYDVEGLNPVPAEAAAKAMGYSSLSGPARRGIATLKMYGLMSSLDAGSVAVSKALQAYKLAPAESTRLASLRDFLLEPEIFRVLSERYPSSLPSDDTITHFLVVERGFGESAARSLARIFRESAEFAQLSQLGTGGEAIPDSANSDQPTDVAVITANQQEAGDSASAALTLGVTNSAVPFPAQSSKRADAYDDPMPVRLRGGRKAWLVLPKPFLEDDKQAVIAQVNLLIADDEDSM